MVGPMDSLNNLMSVDEEDVKEKIKRYFEEMDLEDEEVERRISCATDIEKGFRNLFILMLTAQIVGESLSDRRDDFVDFAYHDYTDAMVENGYSSDEYYTGQGYVEQYARRRCEEIVDTAILHQADSYYFSTDHSIAIGEDETNAVGNYQREQMAIAQGYTMKTWVTFQDDKVRHSHRLLQGRTINIFKPFEVGTGLMMFPLDVSLGVNMKEVYNCRCICEYSGKGSPLSEKEESKKGAINTSTKVDFKIINSKEYSEKLASLGETENITKKIKNIATDIFKHRDGTEYEDLAFLDTTTGKYLINKQFDEKGKSKPTKAMMDMLDVPKTIIGIHNHPHNYVPSISDFVLAEQRNYKYGLALCHDGTIYKYTIVGDLIYPNLESALDIISVPDYDWSKVNKFFLDAGVKLEVL